MKTIIFILLVFFHYTVFCQVTTLATVSDIPSFNGDSFNVLLIRDHIRGGQFTKYTGSDPADDGMIFLDAQSNKWKRFTGSDRVNIQWYGARTANTDNRSHILAALNYIKAHRPEMGTLFIPADKETSTYYQVSDEIQIDFAVRILGEGPIGNPTSKLQFARGKNGLIISYPDSNGGFSAEIKNLLVAGTTGTDTRNINKHGIIIRVQIRLDNIYVTQIEGNGIHVSACALSPSGDNNNYGNADGSYFENVTANFCTNGIFLEGCDANTIQITNSSTNENVRWGIYDNGFLGNSYVKPHFAFNGIPGDNNAVGGKSVVKYNNKYYVARPGFDGYFGDVGAPNINKPPSSNPDYWTEVSAMTHNAWVETERYYSGGPICVRNTNAFTNIFNSYTESFQPPICLNSRSKVDGGLNAAGVEGGSFHNVLYNYEFITNAGIVLPNLPTRQSWLTIGDNTIDYAAPLKVFNDPNLSGTTTSASFQSTRVGNYISIKNSVSAGGIGYNFSDFNFYTNGFSTLITQITPTGIFSGGNNSQEIGSSSVRWKNIFSYDGNFSNAVAIGTSTPNASSLLDLSSTTKGLLLPRMTKAQRNAIVNPSEGLAIYQTDNTPGLRVFNGTNWMKFSESID
jgi:hypothetical protein